MSESSPTSSRPLVWTAAAFSPCGTYRYKLERIWSYGAPLMAVIGFNPSTADAFEDDPTVRRCIGFARRWGFGGLVMLNLYAIRSTDPKGVAAAEDPRGPLNLNVITAETTRCARVVCAWGALAKGHGENVDRVLSLVWKPARFDTVTIGERTKGGFPKHPLYLKSDTPALDYWTGQPIDAPNPEVTL